MQILRILSALTLALVATSTPFVSAADDALAGGNAACGSQRIRKPWESMTKEEQDTYVEAAGLAIKNGIVSDLAAMHIESMGEAQAHHSCAFFTWHRRMLLAYESYLRDLGPKYACVTIPYYDVHTAYVKAANKKCSNIYECSDIFRGIGGPTTSSQVSLTLNGEGTTGYEVKGAPFANSCDDKNKKCGVITRNYLNKISVPSGAGFASFQSIVSGSKDYATFLENIQFGVHNEVHNAVGGAMCTFASPRDIFFFSWHAAIDMFLHTYHLCQIGVPLTENQLKSSLEAFTQASQKCGGVSGVGATSKVVQNVMVNGRLVDITQHPTLGKYFSHVGDEMWNYGDPQKLGDYSYTYELPEIFTKQLLGNKDMCKGFNKALEETPAPTTAAPKPTTVAPKPTTAAPSPATGASTSSSSGSGSDSEVTIDVPTVKPADGSDDSDVPTVKPAGSSSEETSSYGNNNAYGDETDDDDSSNSSSSTSGSSVGQISANVGYDAYGNSIIKTVEVHSGIVIEEGSASGSLEDAGSDKNTTSTGVATTGDYWVWVKTTYDGLVERFEGNMDLVAQQMQLIECQAFDNVFGVTEFSDEFVKNFHLASGRPTCGKKVDAIAAGNVTIAVETVTEFKAEKITFASEEVIKTVKEEYTPLTTSAQPLINPTYVKVAEVEIAKAADAAPATSAGNSGAAQTVVTPTAPVTPAPTKLRASKKKICDY
uniref:Tyrosinase copper-binding domain-containing protein n=1 Tax=Globisporangium ultimum (strain ATCC 200006 / CBS 805.95 / DAOM BR144) TaxID=431595 RepID=K3X3G4_GLOUD